MEHGVAAGVIEVEGDRVRLSHPLLASVVYSEASPLQRREVHARLASVVSDLEERARHLALAADGPAEDIALALESAAISARARGATGSAADLAEAAAAHTPAGNGGPRAVGFCSRRSIWTRSACSRAQSRSSSRSSPSSSPDRYVRELSRRSRSPARPVRRSTRRTWRRRGRTRS